jgi:hypothetical protein
MRFLAVLALLVAGTATAAPRITAAEAVHHRGERVTITGPVAAVETRPDGTVLMIGTDVQVPVRVPEKTRGQLGQKVGALRGRDVGLTGTLTAADQPLELVLDQPEQLVRVAAGTGDDVEQLRARVHELEDEVARMRATLPDGARTGVVYGPSRKEAVIPPYATQTTVLAERGVPSRTGWGQHGQILYYGSERWYFDENGQLLRVERDR